MLGVLLVEVPLALYYALNVVRVLSLRLLFRRRRLLLLGVLVNVGVVLDAI